MKPLVYLAGPITADPLHYAREAILFAREAEIASGVVFIVPQESVLSQVIAPRTHSKWLERDKEVIRRCDALFRLPGPSKGADEEVEFAGTIGIPVFHRLCDLIDWKLSMEIKANG